MKRLLKIIPSIFLLPFVSSAAVNEGPANFDNLEVLLRALEGTINGVIVPAIFTVAFLVFLFGIFKTFILGAADEGKQKEGKTLMLYSLIGFVLMVSIWGIVNLFAVGLGLDDETNINLPQTTNITNPQI